MLEPRTNPFERPDAPPRNAETLYRWICEERMDADEIIKYFDLPPSRLLRMLRGKRLQRKLALQEEIATVLVEQHRRNWMRSVASRLTDLMEARSSEATRKICENLIRGTYMPRPRKRRRRVRAANGEASQTSRTEGCAEAKNNPRFRLAAMEQALQRAMR
jgi:hypothetical protein